MPFSKKNQEFIAKNKGEPTHITPVTLQPSSADQTLGESVEALARFRLWSTCQGMPDIPRVPEGLFPTSR